MTVVRAHEITAKETPGGMATRSLASPGRGAAEVLVLRQRQDPGGHNPPHRHDREEVMVQLTGVATVYIDGAPVDLAPGDVAIVPAGAVHYVENGSDEPAEWMLAAPAGLRFYAAQGEEVTPAFVV